MGRLGMNFSKVLLQLVVFASVTYGQVSAVDFRKAVERNLSAANQRLADICPIDSNIVGRRVFKDYGAMFIASDTVKYPSKCVFTTEEEVLSFQNSVIASTKKIGGVSVTLQEAAMKALDSAIADASKAGLKITPRGGSASKRSFADTARIWNTRFEPALKHWTAKGRITRAAADAARQMEIIDQVERVMKWEEEQIWFSTRFNLSIFSSVAAPGTSQHLSMLALDVSEFSNTRVKAILNKHGWFQTIIDDLPHFTYLGRSESDLPKNGLVKTTRDGVVFWIPNFDR